MKITPNLGTTWRVFYIVLGLAFVASPLVWDSSKWESVLFPVLGGLTVIQGAVGY